MGLVIEMAMSMFEIAYLFWEITNTIDQKYVLKSTAKALQFKWKMKNFERIVLHFHLAFQIVANIFTVAYSIQSNPGDQNPFQIAVQIQSNFGGQQNLFSIAHSIQSNPDGKSHSCRIYYSRFTALAERPLLK